MAALAKGPDFPSTHHPEESGTGTMHSWKSYEMVVGMEGVLKVWQGTVGL